MAKSELLDPRDSPDSETAVEKEQELKMGIGQMAT